MSRVLVVEDDPSIAAVIRYHLESAGFVGTFSSNVEEAWRLLVTQNPDVAVVDIKLPGLDGWNLLEKIRKDPRFKGIPAVVLTGLLEPEIVQRAGSLDCEYLGKPFAASALIAKIKRLTSPEEGKLETIEDAVARENAPPPEKIDMIAVEVVILLEGYQVEGMVHLPPELRRFSEGWESLMHDPREFLPVTNVRITTVEGHMVASTGFVEINKSNIRAVFPMEMDPD